MNLTSDKLIQLEKQRGIGCYIHIPFCDHICYYCDFSKVYYQDDLATNYIKALKQEIKENLTLLPSTMYIGGGTPSALSYEQLEDLLSFLQPYLGKKQEFSIEVNPENCDLKKLELFKRCGVTRLSIGVQTFNEDLLKKIGRKHLNQDVFRLIDQANQLDFQDISIDLMYDLPGQTLEDVKKDLAIVSTLAITHLSYYSLIIEEHTVFYNEQVQKEEQRDYDFGQVIEQTLASQGFIRYEVSNYCKSGHPSLHNSIYWLSLPYYGFGLGAHGYIEKRRIQNTKQLSAYLKGNYHLNIELLTKEDLIFERFLVGLRIQLGIDLKRFKEDFGFDLESRYVKVIDKYTKLKLLKITDGRLQPTSQGMDLLDFILLDL